MKIKSIYMKNFGNISEFSTNLGTGINYCIGSNGAGKSSVGISAIWACLQGIAEKNGNGTEVFKGKRNMWVGRYGTDAEIEIVLTDPAGIDYTVNRKISENKLEITSSDGRKLDQSWINSFFSSMMLSPIAFSRLPAKEQAEFLGIDTSEYDTKIEELKDEAKGIRAVIKSYGEIGIPEKVEAVNIADLSADKDAIVKYNQKQQQARRDIESAEQRVLACELEVESLMQKLQIAQVALDNRKRELKVLPQPQTELSTELVDQKISAASETNAKAIAYEQAVKRQEEKAARENDLSNNLQEQKDEESKKTLYMQGLELPFTNLTIDDKGGLMMDGRPIREPEYSHAECIKISTLLVSSLNPEFKYIFLEDWNTVDSTKSAEIFEWLLGKGFQVLAEKVVSNQSEVLILQDV